MIARLELAHTRAHGFHHARAIGHGDAPVGGGDRADDYGEVMIIQRAAMQPDQDFPRTGRRRRVQLG